MHAALTVACLCLGDAFQGPPRLAPRRALRADGRNAAVAAVEAERRPLAARARTRFRFTRPHTFVGTAVAVPALHAYAAAAAHPRYEISAVLSNCLEEKKKKEDEREKRKRKRAKPQCSR